MLILSMIFVSLAASPSAGANWELKVADLTHQAKQAFGSRYAGVWMDANNNIKVRLGVSPLKISDLKVARRILYSSGLAGGITGVPRTQSELDQANRELGLRLAGANRGASMGISVGEKTDTNQVQMIIPSISFMTTQQKFYIQRATAKYQNLLMVTEDNTALSSLLCRGVFCNPPLRAGVLVYDQYSGCTGGFIGRSRSDGKFYQFTAGHCKTNNISNWLSNFVTGASHIIGHIHKSVFGLSGDAGIIAVNNPAGWTPRAWVLVRGHDNITSNSVYPISSDSVGVVGSRICVSGSASSYTNCGSITRTGVTATYIDADTTVGGLMQASTCVYPGDSGSPAFSYNVAYGIVSGGNKGFIPGGSCIAMIQPINKAENLMNVNTSHTTG